MEATCFRRGRRRRRRRRTGMRLIQIILPTILLWHTLQSVAKTCCLAYTTSRQTTTNAKDTFLDLRSTQRGGVVVLERAGLVPHRRSRTATTTKKTTITNRLKTDNGENDETDTQTTQTALSGGVVVASTNAGRQPRHTSDDNRDDWLFDSRTQRAAFYGILAVLETIFWYCVAPGIDSQSPWFNPLDGKLIASLLNPSTVFSPPVGSGLGFSSLLLNTFLILPMVWSLLLLQERDGDCCETTNDGSTSGGYNNHTFPQSVRKSITTSFRTFACTGGFLVGGGILIPYMMFRRPMAFRRSIDPEKFPVPLGLFEEQQPQPQHQQQQPPKSATNSVSTNPTIFPARPPLPPPPNGQIILLTLTSVVLISFLLPFINHHCDWITEWNAFSDRAHTSQFTALALYDFTMISIAVLDPIMDDALRRGYVVGWDDSNCNDRVVCVSSTTAAAAAAATTTPESFATTTTATTARRSNNYRVDANRDHVGCWRTSDKRNRALRRLAPFVAIPLVGPVAWILVRPRYGIMGPRWRPRQKIKSVSKEEIV